MLFTCGEWVAALVEISFHYHYEVYRTNGFRTTSGIFAKSKKSADCYLFQIQRTIKSPEVHSFISEFTNSKDFEERKTLRKGLIKFIN